MEIEFETFDLGVKHIRAWPQSIWTTHAHYHECIELIYMLRGEIVIRVDEETYRLQASDTIFIPSYAVHEIPEVNDYRYVVLQISLALIPKCEEILNGVNPGVMILRGDETGNLEKLFFTLQQMHRFRGIFADIYDTEDEHFNQVCLFAELVVSTVLFRCRRLGLLRETEKSLPHIDSTVAKAVDYIHAHYQEKLRQQDIADALFVGKQTLAASFGDAMHMSMAKYIESFRAAKAHRLMIQHADIPLNEIAEMVGFQNARNMLRAFKRQYGCTPSEMRNGTDSVG